VSGVSEVTASTGGDLTISRLEASLLVESDYRGDRIEVNTAHIHGVWDAEIRIRRLLTEGEAARRGRHVPEDNREGGRGARRGLGTAMGRRAKRTG